MPDPASSLLGQSDSLTLPVEYHVCHAYTPRESASYGGKDHIVIEAPITAGRLHREAGDALCKPWRKFWGLMRVEEGREPSCARCIEIAGRL